MENESGSLERAWGSVGIAGKSVEIALGLLEKAWRNRWDCWRELVGGVRIAEKSVGKGLVLLEKAWRRR